MPTRITLSRQRTEISKMVLSLMRLSVAYNDSDQFGASFGDALICAAIWIGQHEGRPMAAGKIASYVGIPRPTVARRLDALLASGHIERLDGHFRLPPARLNRPEVIAMITASEAIIHRTSATLSKMDTKAVA